MFDGTFNTVPPLKVASLADELRALRQLAKDRRAVSIALFRKAAKIGSSKPWPARPSPPRAGTVRA